MPTHFEDRFAWQTMSIGAASSLVIALGIGLLGISDAVPGVLVGLMGCISGLVIKSRGAHATAVRVFLVICAIGVGLASGTTPTTQSIGAAGTSWLVLGIFASLLLPIREFMVFGALCWMGTVTMVARASLYGIPDIVPGATVAITFVATGFFVLGWVAQHYRDTTHRAIEAERHAQAALATKSRFMANMSHELRTPLNAIIGYAELLIEDAPTASSAADLERIHSSGTLLLTHINALLDLSKIDAGSMEVHKEVVDVGRLVQEMVALYRPLLERRSNQVVIDVPEHFTLTTDRGKLQQILMNLLTNANKFTHQGVVTVHASFVTNRARIQVSDTGIGIEPNNLPHIFEPFTQADGSTTRRFGGTGLGLTIVRNFATLLGGEVQVSSAFGEGTTFTLLLPDLQAD